MLRRLVRLRSWLFGIQGRVESAKMVVRSWGTVARAAIYTRSIWSIYQKNMVNIFIKTRVEWQLEAGVILRHSALVIGGRSGKAWPYQ